MVNTILKAWKLIVIKRLFQSDETAFFIHLNVITIIYQHKNNTDLTVIVQAIVEISKLKWGVHCVFYDIPETYDTT